MCNVFLQRFYPSIRKQSLPVHSGIWLLLLSSICWTTLSIAQPYGIDKPEPIGKFLNGQLPTIAPTDPIPLTWKVENAFPNLNFVDPLDMREYPGKNTFVVAGKTGLLWTFDNDPNVSSKTLFLDISAQVRISGDGGFMGFVFHPEFGLPNSPNRGFVYVYYRYQSPAGSNGGWGYSRLTRFTVPDGEEIADPQSEYVLIQQFDRGDNHNGGSMFFGPEDGFLYLSIGDEGGTFDPLASTQKINRGFFSGILRIDVDKRGGTISHPIIRQPQGMERPPEGWPGTFSQGYYIPNDNPWVSDDGSTLEEFWALGLRSPHRMWFDAPTGDLWVGDVGQGVREEVSLLKKGSNALWPYREGNHRRIGSDLPEDLFGNPTQPLIDYPRSEGKSIIGGIVYRGEKWASSLGGKYLFSDNEAQKIWTLDYYNSGSLEKELIATIPFETNVWKDGVSHIYTDQVGEVFILQLAGHNRSGGRIYKLAPQTQGAPQIEAPKLLSETGAFSDLPSLTVSPGLIPYQPNLSFWSDGAGKQRWIALPNDGTHNSAEEKINFSETGEWSFPEGTVFLKHFTLPKNDGNPNDVQHIETRFLVHGEDGSYYFLTYKWRENQREADLVQAAEDRTITIQTSSGFREQIWHYPSESECLSCHNATAKRVLGMNTRQMNGSLTYPQSSRNANQLETLNSLNWFQPALLESAIPSYPTLSSPSAASAAIENRALSYLDVNCGYCHRPEALQTNFDLRFTTPLANKGIIEGEVGDNLGIPGAKLIVPGEEASSIIYQRLISLHEAVMMPPLAKRIVDEEGKALIAEWIQSLGIPRDTLAPSIPNGLKAEAITGNSIRLTWNASKDNIQVTGYQVFQDGFPEPIQVTSGTSLQVLGLSPETIYMFAVAAFDSAGNVSEQSAAIQVFTIDSTASCEEAYNLALNQKSYQSSTKGDGVAEIAVDGDRDGSRGNWGPNASITHSLTEAQPFWEVDLGTQAEISEIDIYNRTDSCCISRLRDFYVLVASSPFDTTRSLAERVNDPLVYAQFFAGSAGITESFSLDVSGRYVRIQLSGTSGKLNLAEVEVYGCPLESPDFCAGIPEVNLQPVGPFSVGDAPQLLQASPTGGIWSGEVEANGLFDPTKGPGEYTAIYTIYEGQECQKRDSLTIIVLDSNNPVYCLSPFNLALDKPASQSSTYGDGLASLAVDGNVEGLGGPWGANANITHTISELHPWWQVDLENQANIEEIRITNRQDSCCLSRLNNFYVFVSSQPFGDSLSLDTFISDPTISRYFYEGSAGRVESLSIPSSGRYVRIQLTGTPGTLHLAEVEIMGCPQIAPPLPSCTSPTNLALNRPAIQSSTYGDGQAILAVDGDTSANGGPWGRQANISHTSPETQPWWEVDLENLAEIQEVTIYNRSEECCSPRLRDFYLMISSAPIPQDIPLDTLLGDSSISFTFFPGSASIKESIPVSALGRYVRIQLSSDLGTLHMGEVQVWGCAAESNQVTDNQGFRLSSEEAQNTFPIGNPGYEVYPNPFSTTLSLLQVSGDREKREVTVTDALGKNIYRNVWGFDQKTHVLQTHSWSPGIYILSIQTTAGITSMKIFK